MERLIELDHKLFLFLNNLGSDQWDWFWLLVTDKWTAIPLYAILVYLLFKVFGWKVTLLYLILVTLLITTTDQLANVFKDGFQRLRPCGQEGIREYARFVAVRCGKYGYFSAHAANSFGVAVFLGLLFKKKFPTLLYFLLLWAGLVAYSRVYLGVHYPGDILTGAVIGVFFGFVYYLIQKYLLKLFKL
ncbi:phosphatase PAP2 family protein [Salegentibacter sp. F14]